MDDNIVAIVGIIGLLAFLAFLSFQKPPVQVPVPVTTISLRDLRNASMILSELREHG